MKNNESIEVQSNFKRVRIEIDLINLPSDPCLRKKIFDYHPSDRDKVRIILILMNYLFFALVKIFN
jgi:hypothetical protein